MPERADLAPNPVFATARAHARDSRIDRHAHRRAQLIVLAQGALRLECDDRVLTVPPGQAAFLPGGLPHKTRARVALVLGESEVADGTVVVKDLRSGEQTAVAQDSVAAHLRTLLG